MKTQLERVNRRLAETARSLGIDPENIKERPIEETLKALENLNRRLEEAKK